MKRIKPTKLSEQIKKHSEKKIEPELEFDGNINYTISTGSTLLDLVISGGRIKYGGLPSGIIVEIFGPENSGKTALLSQIAGAIQRLNGEVEYNDTEDRFDTNYASLFGMNANEATIYTNNSIRETFKRIREWEPSGSINGAFIDSLANLDEPDTEGGYSAMRRAAVFTEEIRRTAAIIKNKNIIIVCSNQLRDKKNVMGFGETTRAAGSSRQALHQFSLRLKIKSVEELKETKTINGKKIRKTVGQKLRIKVIKSSIDEAYREATVTITFGYGIDDIRDNLEYIKYINGKYPIMLDCSTLPKCIEYVESNDLEKKIKKQVMNIWNEVEKKFKPNRKRKRRF